jgi:hypothetical protein
MGGDIVRFPAAAVRRHAGSVQADILETDDDPDEVLKYAALTFDQLYSGGRNFADLIIYRADPQERVAANERLAGLTGELRQLLHGT